MSLELSAYVMLENLDFYLLRTEEDLRLRVIICRHLKGRAQE